MNGHISIVKYLAKEGSCKIDGVDKFKRSPAHWAARFNMVRMLEVLNDLGIFLDSMDIE